MARLKDQAIGSKDAFLFDPEQIEEKAGYNVRNMDSHEVQEHIRKMANAIHASGTTSFPPITICQEGGKIYVVAGHCRRRAFILAKNEGAPIKGILAIANTQNEADQTLDLLNSEDGLHLTPLEKAKAVHRLTTFDWTIQEIARRRGVSTTSISNLLALLDAPADVVHMVEAGKVSATLAVTTVRQEGALLAGVTLSDAVKVAEGKGKVKATAKHVHQSRPVTDWKDLAGKLKTALALIVHASGNEAQQAAIDLASTLLDELRG